MITLVTGGARSGKSTFAERYARHLGKSGIYIATAQVYDAEMRARVNDHRERRDAAGFPWETVEEPYELARLLTSLNAALPPDRVILVDCLTLWLSNWLLRYEEAGAAQKTDDEIDRLAALLPSFRGNLILVTNEVGAGIVPEYPLGRKFRDLAGRLNQRLAQESGRVFLVTAGIPVDLQSLAFRFVSE